MSAQRKTRVAVFVSGGGTNLQALIDARDAGRLPDGEIALVVSNKTAYARRVRNGPASPTDVARRGICADKAFQPKSWSP